MSVENPWIPATPVKPSRRPLHAEENQQKSDGSTEEIEAGKVLACSDASDLVVDLNEMKWIGNEASSCSISASSDKPESVSQGELCSKSMPHFVPPTPDKGANVELKQFVESQSTLAGGKKEEGQEENCRTVSIRTDEDGLEQEGCELVLDSSCAPLLTPIMYNESSDKDVAVSGNEIAKLKQYKRKHRPKVITEGKPRTSKSTIKRAANSQENLKTKRKYVRKNAVHKPLESPRELGTLSPVTPEVTGSKENSTGLRTYTRKRVVDTPETSMVKTGATDAEVQKRKRSRKTCRRSLKFDNEGKQKDENSLFEYSSNTSGLLAHILTTESYQPHSMLKQRRESDAVFDHRQAGMSCNPNPSMNHQPENCKCLPESQVSSVEVPIEYSTALLKLKVNHHKNHRGTGKSNSTSHLLSSSKDSFWSSTTVSTERKEARGLKRKCSHNIRQDCVRSFDLIEEFYNSIYASQLPHAEYFSEEKIDEVQHSGQNPCTSNASYSIPRPQPHSCLIPWSDQSNMRSIYSPKQPSVITDLQRIENSHRHHPSSGAQVDKMHATAARKIQKPHPLTKRSHMHGADQHPKLSSYCHCHTSQLPPVASWLELFTNAMVEEMKILDINREGKISLYEEHNEMVTYNMQNQGHNALVVYRGDGSIVPFEGSLNPVKKRRRYAKVDLDGETIRVWKLLMDNSNNELVDGSDEDRDKWWEEERRVFSGRTDSFIAKMHLIQGNRGFSQWKGSVLDSVIGVFLTQNVSDHLSSSAFMSLAARYPLKSRSLDESSVDERTSLVVNEPQANLCREEDSVAWVEQISDQPIYKQNCMTMCGTGQDEEDFFISSESSRSNTSGVSSMHEYQCSTVSCVSQNIGKLEDRRTTAETNTIVEARTLGEEKTADAAILSKTSTVSEDKMPCLKSNCGKDLSSRDISVNGPDSSVEVVQTIETNKLKSDSKIASGTDSSDDKSEGTCTSEEKNVDQIEKNDNADCHKCLSKESPSHSSNLLQKTSIFGVTEVECFEMCGEVAPFSYVYKRRDVYDTSERTQTLDSLSQTTILNTDDLQAKGHPGELCNLSQSDQNVIFQSEGRLIAVPHDMESQDSMGNREIHQTLPNSLVDNALDVTGKTEEPVQNEHDHSLSINFDDPKADTLKPNRERVKREKRVGVDWDNLRKLAEASGTRERTTNTMDSLDWEAVRCADIDEIAYTIRERGMNNRLAERIKDFLNRLVKDHGSIDLEWLRDVPPDQAKEYLLSVRGLGLKSVECVRLLTLQQLAFPVDTNVGRIAVRLGWVPLQPLPESLQLHLLELYPVLESIQKYLWPRLCKLDQRTLYELHYQMITFGKVFCTKNKPNCNACPMRGECRHFASAFASARLALPAPEEANLINAAEIKADINQSVVVHQQPLTLTQESEPIESNQQLITVKSGGSNNEPIIEEPATPEPECPQISENDIEDTLYEDPDEIPTIKLNIEAFTKNVQNYMQENMELQEGSMSKALVVLSPEAALIPMPKLKNISRLRTEHQVYELPDAHPLLEKLKLEKRQPDDPCFYLLAIWTPGETANSVERPHTQCRSQESGGLCGEKECFSCNSVREADSEVVRGTLLIPCRTAMRGSFPLNGTYFQVNEVFADHDSSLNPIDVPRNWLWKLSRRTVYFGTSIPTIFKGLSTEEIQGCFWKGYVCVRGFDQKTRAPRPLIARLHFPASKLTKIKGGKDGQAR
ncbi:transcriptional activator DEMETER-like [Cucurbita pepo subsp. pepo]|uniref:transcriptional activator DEMETER-like n=1 Tax=Cucurbita pepo subsp. pepo TaxID=3664 RepID=UPI000C9D53B5|nr:transcriptional activator DEMETER-like [Cucurbita pepo subsp. pepo]